MSTLLRLLKKDPDLLWMRKMEKKPAQQMRTNASPEQGRRPVEGCSTAQEEMHSSVLLLQNGSS